MQDNIIISEKNIIQNKIYTLRNIQVMLDRDLADFYEIKATRLREQVNRNIKKFPDDFMFELSENEIEYMVSQNAIPSKQHLGGAKPMVFTEQGVSMLPSILRSEKAIDISIQIIRTFVNMKKIISQNNYIDQNTLLHLNSKTNKDIKINIITKSISKELKQDIEKYNKQNNNLSIYEYKNSHDRFLIIDEKIIYHIGASLKDLGNKWFAFSRLENDNLELLEKTNKLIKGNK